MKAISLLLLRLSTGIYLILWGFVKVFATDTANAVSDKYYNGFLNGELLNYALGSVQILVGLLVCLGLFRKLAYPAQTAWYIAGLLPILFYILDPFGLYLVSAQKLTFFPSTTLLFACLIMHAFQEYDTLALDKKFS